MKKLVLYSDQIINKTKNVDNGLINLINKQNPKIGFIPSCSDLTRKHFNERREHYKSLGITDLCYFDFMPHWEQNRGLLSELLEYSERKNRVIYTLSDGNGIIVNNNKIKFLGNIIKIENGKIKEI